jgi:hypothetical protein
VSLAALVHSLCCHVVWIAGCLPGACVIGPPASSVQIEVPLPREAAAPGRSSRESATAKLAKFFPDSTPLRIAVSLTRVEGKGGLLSESTVIEFGTPHEVLFASTLPLEFADKLRLRNSDGTLDVEACVVALQYNGSRTAVAARFTQEVANWIVKP